MVANLDVLAEEPVRPRKLAHVVLRTNQLKEMAAFYKTFLGGYASHENEFVSFIAYDDEHHRIAIAQIPSLGPKNKQTCGLEHIAFTFDSLEDVFMAYKQRKSKGIEPFWCINHGITISLYYYDPDKNILETQVDVFSKSEDASAYMAGPEFAENPIGAEFNPEEFIARIKSGESFESLTKRPNVGRKGMEAIPSV